MKQKKENIFENKSLMIWKMAIASAISWEVARLTGSHHPYLAPLTVILCLKAMLDRTIHFSFYRLIGTILGVLLIALISKHIHVNGWTLGLLILTGSFVAKWLKLNETVIEQVAMTILLVLALEPHSNYYAFDRIKDTFIGAVFSIIINIYLFSFTFVKRTEAAYCTYLSELSSLFIEYSEWIKTGCDPVQGTQYQKQLKQDYQDLLKMYKDLKKTSKILSLSPFCKKKGERLTTYYKKAKTICDGYSYLLNATEVFKEWGSSMAMSDEEKNMWSNQMRGFSKNVRGIEKELSTPQQDELQMSLLAEHMEKRYHVVFFQETNQFMNNLHTSRAKVSRKM